MVIFLPFSDCVQQLSESKFSKENSWNHLNNWKKLSRIIILLLTITTITSVFFLSFFMILFIKSSIHMVVFIFIFDFWPFNPNLLWSFKTMQFYVVMLTSRAFWKPFWLFFFMMAIGITPRPTLNFFKEFYYWSWEK